MHLRFCKCTSVFVLLLLAIAAAPLAGQSASAQWLDVPFVRQEKNGCGAAVVFMLMQYWDKKDAARLSTPDLKAIQRRLFSAEAKGIFASELAQYLESHSYRTFILRGDWNEIETQIAKGRPLIVALGRLSGSTLLHYVVVAGTDATNNVVLVNDPARRKLLKLSRAEFEKAWKTTDNWLLLALPHAVS